MLYNDQKKKVEKKTSNSFIWRSLNALAFSIYSFFAGSGIVRKITESNGVFDRSLISRFTQKRIAKRYNRSQRNIELLFEQSRPLNFLSRLRVVFSSMSINIYGTFFFVYSLISIFMFYIALTLNGKHDFGSSAIITPIVMLVCSIPMLFSSASVANAISGSRTMRKIVLSFFSIPEEKLRTKSTIGGSEFVFMSAILAVLLGILTYFLHPAYVPVIMGAVIAIFLISANPETGVLMTVAVAPFLQYTKYDKEILCIMILISALSYFSKVIKRRRTFSVTSEGIFVFIFCGFILVASVFSQGGLETFKEAIYSIMLIAGGFFMTYNLVKGEDRLQICNKILLVGFCAICLSGIWNVFYNAIVEHNIYSIREEVRPIFENNVIYIADNVSLFSVMAVLCMPLLLSNIVQRDNFKGKVLSIIMTALSVITVFVYGSYEAVIAIALEIIIFSLLYSHKTLSAMIVALIPVSLIIVIYSQVKYLFDGPDIVDALRGLLPLNDPISAYRSSISEGVIDMIKNGNWSGIGVGEHAFKISYAPFANVVTEGITTTGSFWLQLVCWSGVGGMICFIVMAITLIVKAFGYSLAVKDPIAKGDIIALLCSFTTVLLFGAVNGLWLDSKTLYLFWVFAGLLVGYIQKIKAEDRRRLSEFADSFSDKDIELRG